jgi:hypothetical protein
MTEDRFLNHCGFEGSFRIKLRVVLLAGLDWQRVKKLYRDTAKAGVYRIHATDMTTADKFSHIETCIRPVKRHAEPGRDVLAGIEPGAVRIARKGRSAAADIDHLTLGQYSGKIIGKPDRPVIA